jgi:trimeric autotransporter adhesin
MVTQDSQPAITTGISPRRGSYPRNLANVNGIPYFTFNDSINGYELWRIDSTGNAVLVKDINPGIDSSYPQQFINVNGTSYFRAGDATNGTELWKIDGTGNAVLVEDINPGSDSSAPGNLTDVNGKLYFTVSNPANGQELWTMDSTGDAVLVKNLGFGSDLSYPGDLTNVNGKLYFTVSNPTNGQELWTIDNTGNTVLAKNLGSGSDSSSSSFTNVNGNLYFVTNKFIRSLDSITSLGQELWKIDGTGNAVLVKYINSNTDSSYLSNLTNVNGTLYFTANDASRHELWRIDSIGNTVLVKDINPGGGSYGSSTLTNVNVTLYFTARNATNGEELWRIDSTGNPVLVKNINPSGGSYGPSTLTSVNVNGTLYFTADDATNGRELWRTDSTGNAELVKDINPGGGSSTPLDLTNVGGALYFTAYNATTGRELWKIDDTGNAVLVNDINPGGNSRDPYFDTFAVDPGFPPVHPPLLLNNNVLETTSGISGVSIQAVSQKQTNKVNEIGFFNVDDRNGKIDGIAPGESGYIKVVIDRAKSILTTLGGDFFNTEKQEIGLDPNKIFQFFEIENGSLTEVKQQLNKGEVPTNIRLSNFDPNGYNPIKITGNSIQSGYNISINNDELVLKVTKLDGIVPNRPIGSEAQGKIEGRIIDLTKYADRSLTVDITTKSDAVYQSQIGFYVVKDATGTIELADGTTVKPGDANYAMVAIKNAIANGGLQANRIDSKTNQPIAGGQIYAPVVVAQGTMNDFVNKASNNIHAYFNYVGANTDKVDHFRQIGANTFGVEDMYGGGDRDFNDIVIQMNIKIT